MLITWLFGNGLDLSFGLKTSYCDFYEYLQQKKDEVQDNLIYKLLSNDKKHNKINLWSDYENRLGEITDLISKEEIEKFKDDKIDIDMHLRDYLKLEESKLLIDAENNKKILSTSFKQIGECGKDEDNNRIKELFNKHNNANFQFNAISFNYTKTVSLLWGENKNIVKDTKINCCPSYPCGCFLEDPFYIHGTLDDGEMVIGVNDNSQISNDILKACTGTDDVLIKGNLLEEAGQAHRTNYEKIINNNLLICVYGMSIGKNR